VRRGGGNVVPFSALSADGSGGPNLGGHAPDPAEAAAALPAGGRRGITHRGRRYFLAGLHQRSALCRERVTARGMVELALAPTFRTDFRESLYRLVGALKGTGIIVMITMEILQSTTELRLSPDVISFLADNIILLHYVEIAGQLRKGLRVIKMRNSDHSKDLRLYEITAQGMIDALATYFTRQ